MTQYEGEEERNGRPDGRTYGFDAVDVFDVDGDEITRLTNWYDLVLVRKMLAGSGPELAEPATPQAEMPAKKSH